MRRSARSLAKSGSVKNGQDDVRLQGCRSAYLKVVREVICTHSLNLRRAESPADVVNEIDILSCGLRWSGLLGCQSHRRKRSSRLLQLEQFSGLPEVLELQLTLFYVVTLAPVVNSGDVELYL